MLAQFWRSLGRFSGYLERQQQWFMQDGAAPHTAKRVLAWIKGHFGARVISRFTEHSWASHSPDLNPLDFFLWGYIKDQIVGAQFQTTQDLKDRVALLLQAVTPEQCKNATDHFMMRAKKCFDRDGGHVEHVM